MENLHTAKTRRPFDFLSLSILALVMPVVALATSFAERPFPDGVKDAPVIVRGRIGSFYSEWAKNPDGGRRIFTYYDLAIDEVFKGSVNTRSLVMRELGGSKDGIGLEVPGTAKFQRGEDVVVFLGERNGDGSYNVRGMMMGKYNVVHDQNDGKDYLMGAGLSFNPDHQIHDEHDGQDDTGHQKMSLDSLRQLIASQAGAVPPTPKPVNSPEIRNSGTPSASSSPAPSPEAPHLQTNTLQAEPEQAPEGRQSSFGYILAALAALGALVFLLTRRN